MTKYDELFQDLVNLMATLEGCKVVDRVKEHFDKYGNDAPPIVLRRYMDKVQSHIDEASKACKPVKKVT